LSTFFQHISDILLDSFRVSFPSSCLVGTFVLLGLVYVKHIKDKM